MSVTSVAMKIQCRDTVAFNKLDISNNTTGVQPFPYAVNRNNKSSMQPFYMFESVVH